jgi:hypothetical protein
MSGLWFYARSFSAGPWVEISEQMLVPRRFGAYWNGGEQLGIFFAKATKGMLDISDLAGC